MKSIQYSNVTIIEKLDQIIKWQRDFDDRRYLGYMLNAIYILSSTGIALLALSESFGEPMIFMIGIIFMISVPVVIILLALIIIMDKMNY